VDGASDKFGSEKVGGVPVRLDKIRVYLPAESHGLRLKDRFITQKVTSDEIVLSSLLAMICKKEKVQLDPAKHVFRRHVFRMQPARNPRAIRTDSAARIPQHAFRSTHSRSTHSAARIPQHAFRSTHSAARIPAARIPQPMFQQAATRVYPACIPRVSRVYPACTPRVPRVYPACIPRVPRVYPACTPRVPRVYPACTPRVPRVYPACTPRVSRVYPACTPRVPRVYPAGRWETPPAVSLSRGGRSST
jgi:hypothetical protein